MSKGLFRSHNKVGETLSFQIMSDPSVNFTPEVTKINGRVSWDLDNGNGYTAGDSISYNYPGPQTLKNITLRTNLLSTLNSIDFSNDNIMGHLDLSGLSDLFNVAPRNFILDNNTGLTAVTITYTPHKSNIFNIDNCNLTGTLNLQDLGDMGGQVKIENNPNLTKILFSGDTGGFTNLFFDGNNLIDLDLSSFKNFATQFKCISNPNITGLTFHTGTSITTTSYFLANALTTYVGDLNLSGLKLEGYFDIRSTKCEKLLHGFNNGTWLKYWVSSCNITGNHDLSMFPTLGGSILIGDNTNLTSVTHTASSETIYTYRLNDCDITGTHQLPFTQMGGIFDMHHNPNLTQVTHSASTQAFSGYTLYDCDLTGFLDLSMLSKIGGDFQCYNNPNLLGITHSSVADNYEVFTSYKINDCSVGGLLNVQTFKGLGGYFNVSNNTNLKNVFFPNSTQTFANASGGNYAFTMNGCGWGGSQVDFKPLSASTMDVNSPLGASIELQDCTLNSTDVNEFLQDFRFIANNNTSGWSGVTLNIGGTNSAPDTTSGGIDGIAARNSLTGSPFNWTIITS